MYNEEIRDLLAAPERMRPLEVSALAAGALPPGAASAWGTAGPVGWDGPESIKLHR